MNWFALEHSTPKHTIQNWSDDFSHFKVNYNRCSKEINHLTRTGKRSENQPTNQTSATQQHFQVNSKVSIAMQFKAKQISVMLLSSFPETHQVKSPVQPTST